MDGAIVGGCPSSLVFDDGTPGASLPLDELIERTSWRFAWTPIAPHVAASIRLPAADTEDPYDLYDLYDLYGDDPRTRAVVGGVVEAADAPRSAPTADTVTTGFLLDEAFQTLPRQDPNAPPELLFWDEMLPDRDGVRPLRGVYQVRSRHRWDARRLLWNKR